MSPEPELETALVRLATDAPDALRGRALDLAAGRGRNTLLVARRGQSVDAWDRDPIALDELGAAARKEGLEIRTTVVDLEAPGFALPPARWSLIVVVNYLHRPLCRSIAEALTPGGVLFYQTFTTEQTRFGKPTNPDFLLRPGELRSLFSGLDELSYAEGEIESGGVRSAKATRLARRPQR